ncbi:hypothetical protein DFR62_1610 [Planococcus citreus]|uniref:Uncharacterized protein n=1 Tax=Planococcus citreus TaxID=1373 RepID=A0A497YX90_9BACL|nr:hypothetical protein DFR62_1610 [Planococcus citreus]
MDKWFSKYRRSLSGRLAHQHFDASLKIWELG